MRRSLKLITVVALPLSMITFAGGTAGAMGSTPSPVNATNYTVSCTSFFGALKFKPKLEADPGPFTGTVKGSLFGCVVTPSAGGTPVDIVKTKVTGSITFELTNNQNDCSVFLGNGSGPVTYPASGTLTVQWKTAHRTPALSSGESVIHFTSVEQDSPSGAVLVAVPGSPGAISSSGSFSGTDAGASDSFAFQDGAGQEFFQKCFAPPFLSKVFFSYFTPFPFTLG